jgi:hypothetical protein
MPMKPLGAICREFVIAVEGAVDVSEEQRLKYRYVDLQRPRMQRNKSGDRALRQDNKWRRPSRCGKSGCAGN